MHDRNVRSERWPERLHRFERPTCTESAGDNPFAQEAWAQKEKITVPLLSDYEHKVAKEYGVMYESFLPQMNLGIAACRNVLHLSSIKWRDPILREQR